MSEVKKIENAKVELTCTVDGDKWSSAIKKAFKKLSANLEVKGFRKGQVPESIVKKHITDEQVQFEAAQDVAQEALVEGIKENDLELIDRPELKIDSVNADACKLTFVCPVTPDVKLGDYKKLEYKVEEVSVSDGDVEAEIDKLKEQKAELEIKEDGTVEKGDITVIDFEGFKDGVAFEGGKGENYELTIGSGQFIPGFEDQLIGMKAEEEKEINVSFPEDYHVEDLKGKPVVFKVKLHEIKKKVLATIDDELVKDLKIKDVNTVDELKNYIKDNLLKNKKFEAENKATEELLNKLIEGSEIDIPEVMISREQEQLVNDYSQRFMSQGITLDQFMKITGQTLDQMKEGFKPEAIKRIKTTLCLGELSKIEKLEPTAEDIAKQYEDMAKQYNMQVDDVKKYVTDDQIKSDLKLEKALDFLRK
ncbi:MAG: trigger factor [Erysipelotrichaceae bacterium]|nr:trigger factor [Erysipelotrichaceae bacterium]